MLPATFLFSSLVAACPEFSGSHSSAGNLYSAFLKCLCFTAFVFFFGDSAAQNYFANPGFEDLNTCTEYHQTCYSEAWFPLRPAITPLINYKIVPHPANSKDLLIVQVENVYAPGKKRSFAYTMFCCPLTKGKLYKLSMYINTGGKAFYGLDFYMRKKEFTSDNFSPDSIAPDIHIPANAVNNLFGEWNYIESDYTARGDEQFFMVGNLSKNHFEFNSYQRMNNSGDVFYFLDDISFRPINPEPLCKEFESKRRKLYEQNLRHTEHALVDTFPDALTDTITIPAVYFETDKAVLKPAFKKLINDLLLKFRDRRIIGLLIEGHTDNAGTSEHNTLLSTRRAESVRDYFINTSPALKPIISGEGENRPIASNSTKAGMAKNRRVEIIITYTDLKK